jgi:hypothetical protein
VRLLRRLLGLLLLAGAIVAGVIVYRRRVASRRERADLYYEDGSMVSLDEGSVQAGRLLSLAYDTLRAAS